MIRSNPEEFALACRLRKLGVPFDEDEFEAMRVDGCGLSIQQGGILPNIVFNLSCGGAGFIFNAEISNDSQRNLSPADVDFDGPLCGLGMRLLQDPRQGYPRKLYYSFPAPRVAGPRKPSSFDPAPEPDAYERDIVLNHLINRRCVLRPGKTLDGLLLVVGEMQIPWEYRDGDRLKVSLTVFDQRGRSDQEPFWLRVERSRYETQFIQRIESMTPDQIREKKLAVAKKLGSRIEDASAWLDYPAPSLSSQPDKEVADDPCEPVLATR